MGMVLSDERGHFMLSPVWLEQNKCQYSLESACGQLWLRKGMLSVESSFRSAVMHK